MALPATMVFVIAAALPAYEQALQTPEAAVEAGPTGRALAESLAKARPGAVHDARLSAACGEFLDGKVFAPSAVSGAADFEVFRYLLWRQGIGDTVLLPYRGRFENEAKAKAAMKGVAAQLVATPFNRFGIATRVDAKKHVDVAIVVAQRDVGFSPIPRVVEPGAPIETVIRTSAPREVRVLVQQPQGTTVEHAVGKVESESPPVTLSLAADRGRYDVEIVFLEEAGPYISASFPVFVGEEFPERFLAPTYEPEAGKVPDAEIEKRLVDLVNGTRARYRLAPVRIDATLSRIAREHSVEMRKAGFGRASPTHGALTKRLERAGVWFRDATEVIGAGVSAAAIHGSLMSSPAHRIVLLDARLEDAGIGVAVVKGAGGTPQLYVTEVLATLVPKIDPAEASKRLLERLNAKRAEAGAPALTTDPALAAVAATHARAMAAGGEPAYEIPAARKGAKAASLFDSAKAAAPGAKALGGFVGVLATLEDPLEFEGALDADMTRAGIGIVQSSSREYGTGAIWIAVVVAR